ncbi:ficolin-2-like [Saccostrea cucullata]|uniref:ficolin-2-like n=1 Tax=Saccostrea cuccullata TaxID=36930 RepID=UPI002ED45C33
MLVCHKFTLCGSVDWSKTDRICVLNAKNHTKNSTFSLTKTENIHVDRKDFPEAVAGDCLLHSCNLNWICINVPVVRETCLDHLREDSHLRGRDGVYQIYVASEVKAVYCDMSTDGGGWTAIQRRQDNSTDFFRTWIEYKEGFGDPFRNYWIGNDAIHTLTKKGDLELRIELQRFNGERAFAQYSTFSIGNEDSYYKLLVSGYSGTAGDSLTYHNNRRFATKDSDVVYLGRYCATERHGAWWYYHCSYSNLNAKYGDVGDNGPGYVVWDHWTGGESLKETMMMIRESP